MINLSKKDIENLGISGYDINQYIKNGLLNLALKAVGYKGQNYIDDKIYSYETIEAVNLIKQLEQEKNSDDEIRKELEKIFKEREEKRLKFREWKGLRKPKDF